MPIPENSVDKANFLPNSLFEWYFFHKRVNRAATILHCIDSAYADEFASDIKHLCDVFSEQTIISEIVSNVDTKDR